MTIYVHFSCLSCLFNGVDIEQVRSSYTFTKLTSPYVRKVTYIFNKVHNYAKQQNIKLSLTVNSDIACKSQKTCYYPATILLTFHESVREPGSV